MLRIPGGRSYASLFARSAALLVLASLPMAATSATPAAAAPAATDVSPELIRAIDRQLAETYPADQPGAVVLIARDGKTLLRKGYGLANLELGVPLEPDMVFPVGSITKTFTAAAVLLLAERGQLALEDEVTRFLPDYPTHGQKITLEHLLTHTSGIPDYAALDEWQEQWRKDVTPDELLALFRGRPLEFAPGERFAISDSGYAVLGAVIEKVSGKSYGRFIEEEIFRPLGMKHSSYADPGRLVPRRASGYDPARGGGYVNTSYLSPSQTYAAGALLSTADDLAAWDRALQGETLLKRASVERMLTPFRLRSGQSARYAYGWSVIDFEGRRIVEHEGSYSGYYSHLLRVPQERLLIAVLTNCPGRDPEPSALAIRIAARMFGKPIEEQRGARLDPALLDEYVGVYKIDEQSRRIVTREGDKLFTQRRGAGRLEVEAVGRDEFFYPGTIARLRFRRDAQGKVDGAVLTMRIGPEEVAVKTGEPLPAERKAVRIDPAVFDAYTGEYQLAPGVTLTLSREGERYFSQATGRPKVEIFPESETRFFLRNADVQIELVRGADGKVGELILHQGAQQVRSPRLR